MTIKENYVLERRTSKTSGADFKPLICAQNVSLHVPIVQANEKQLMANPLGILKDLYFTRRQRSVATLLDQVSLTVNRGDRLGLIGRNGAGKSTLLRVFSSIYKPSSGNLAVNGFAKGLFDVSLGMKLDATGLENIYFRGLQMGMSLAEIRDSVKDIAEFSELTESMNKPLNTYSAGMRLRLALSISTMISPDILLLDEWVGAGDRDFSSKIKGRMLDIVENAGALVLATHNTSLMRSLCNKGAVLENGRLVYSGGIDDALEFYNTNI